MTSLLAACGGFLLAVLWMDLLFDVQVRRLARHGDAAVEPVISSIASYYRRVTTDAAPLNRLIGTVMLVTVAGSVYRVVTTPSATTLLALGLCALPIGLAAVRVLPSAVRLGRRADPIAVQRELARAIFRDHVLCFAAIGAFTALALCT